MKSSKTISLGDAIRKFYKTKPLNIDLANSVADRVFAKSKIEYAISDTWMYGFVTVLIIFGLIYGLSLIKQFTLSLGFIIVIPTTCYIILIVKEYILLSKRIHSFK